MKTSFPCPWCGKRLGPWFLLWVKDPHRMICSGCKQMLTPNQPWSQVMSWLWLLVVTVVGFLVWKGLNLGALIGPELLFLYIPGLLVGSDVLVSIMYLQFTEFRRVEAAPAIEDEGSKNGNSTGTAPAMVSRAGCGVSLLFLSYVVVSLMSFTLLGFGFVAEQGLVQEIPYSIEVGNATDSPLDVRELRVLGEGVWGLDASGLVLNPWHVIPPQGKITVSKEGLSKPTFAVIAIPSGDGLKLLKEPSFKRGTETNEGMSVVFTPLDFANPTPLPGNVRLGTGLLLYSIVIILIGGLFLRFGRLSSESEGLAYLIISLSILILTVEAAFLVRVGWRLWTVVSFL